MNNEAIDWDYDKPFVQEVEASAEHIDGLNHVNNNIYGQWCEQAAWAHSESLGISLKDYQELDRAMAIVRSEYDYLLPALLNEELLVATWLTENDGKLNMQRRFQIVRKADGKTLVRGLWKFVCIQISTGRPKRMPELFVDKYGQALTEAIHN